MPYNIEIQDLSGVAGNEIALPIDKALVIEEQDNHSNQEKKQLKKLDDDTIINTSVENTYDADTEEDSIETAKASVEEESKVDYTKNDVSDWLTTDSSNDWDSESSSIDYYPISPEDSFLMKLELPLTESEKSLIDEFYKEMQKVVKDNDEESRNSNSNVNCTKSALKHVENTTNKYLKKGIRLNSKCSDNENTVTTLVFEEMENILERSECGNQSIKIYGNPNDDALLNGDNQEIISNIIKNLLLKGGKVKRSLFYDDRLSYITKGIDYEIFLKYEEIQNKLKIVAYESIINKKGNPEVEIDNGCFGIKYSQNSIVEVTKILNNQEVKDLNLKVGILQIGKSIVRVETVEGKRNYTDVPEGGIKMSFTTEVGKIGIHLHHIDSNKVRVELCEESKERFCKLKNKSSLGKNCLLGGKSVLQTIKDGEFIKNKEPPSTFMERISISHIFDGLKNCFNQFGKGVSGG